MGSASGSDLVVIAVYIIGIFILALKSTSRLADSDSGDREYLANKSLSLRESLLSIVATETSALTFLGIPAYCYTQDFSFLQIYMGAFFGRILIARNFLPVIYNKGMTIYEIIAGGESRAGQRLLSLFFVISKILSVGVRLYSGSILVAQFFQIPTSLGVVIVAVMTFFYTIIGGLKAVVATDSVQFFIFLLGGILAHYLIPSMGSGSNWGELMTSAYHGGKTALFAWNAEGLKLFAIGLAGGFLFDMATHGVDQDYTQRLLACRNLPTAQRAIFLSSFFSLGLGTLFLGVGALLWAYYQQNPLPSGIAPDHLFAYFITQYFPSPLKGIMMAGILAATMSTLDSTLNALSSCLWNDIFPSKTPNGPSVRGRSRRRRHLFSLLMLLALVGVALLSGLNNSLLLLGLKIASWTGGPLLAIFVARVLLSMPVPFNPQIVLTAHLFGLAAVALNTFVLNLNWNFNIYFGFLGSLLGIFMSLHFLYKTYKRP